MHMISHILRQQMNGSNLNQQSFRHQNSASGVKNATLVRPSGRGFRTGGWKRTLSQNQWTKNSCFFSRASEKKGENYGKNEDDDAVSSSVPAGKSGKGTSQNRYQEGLLLCGSCFNALDQGEIIEFVWHISPNRGSSGESGLFEARLM